MRRKIKAVVSKKLKMALYPKNFNVKSHFYGVSFLGYHIFVKYNLNFQQKYQRVKKQHRLSNRIKLFVPIDKIMGKYVEKGFLRKERDVKHGAKRIGRYTFTINDNVAASKVNYALQNLEKYYAGGIYSSVLHELYVLLQRLIEIKRRRVDLRFRHEVKI